VSEPHTYRCAIEWTGSTKDYNAFSRNHRAAFESKPAIEMTAAPEYRGDPARSNPEDLLVAALASCQMLTYLAIAAMSKVEVLEYHDEAVGKVEKGQDGRMKMTTVNLRPRITISADSNRDRAVGLVTKAHEQCFIANSVTTQVTVEPEFETR
jgi:organic hydroperoxide reductase OsmC/OhrA